MGFVDQQQQAGMLTSSGRDVVDQRQPQFALFHPTVRKPQFVENGLQQSTPRADAAAGQHRYRQSIAKIGCQPLTQKRLAGPRRANDDPRPFATLDNARERSAGRLAGRRREKSLGARGSSKGLATQVKKRFVHAFGLTPTWPARYLRADHSDSLRTLSKVRLDRPCRCIFCQEGAISCAAFLVGRLCQRQHPRCLAHCTCLRFRRHPTANQSVPCVPVQPSLAIATRSSAVRK